MQKIIFILVSSHILGAINCFADDISGLDLNRALDGEVSVEGERQNSVALAKEQFHALKRRGTVWLRTQKAMDKLLAIEGKDDKAALEKLAVKILQDCRLIDNQIALERARYLLATLESSDAEPRSLEAIRAMVMAADGKAALALAEDATKAFYARSSSGH